MSIKTTLTNSPTVAVQIIGVLFILASIVGFSSGGLVWPMLGSGAGTGLVILGWERTREKLAAPRVDHLTSNRETIERRHRRQLDLFAGGNESMSEYPAKVWEDHEGTLQFDIVGLVQHFNVLDTPENRAVLEEELRATFKENKKSAASRKYGMTPMGLDCKRTPERPPDSGS